MRSRDRHLFPYCFRENSLARSSSLAQKGKLLTNKTKLSVMKYLYFFKNLNFVTYCFHLTKLSLKLCLIVF